MNEFNVYTIAIVLSGKPELEGEFKKVAILSFVSGALHALLFLYSLKQMLSKTTYRIQILCALLASILGAICSIVFFAVETKYAVSFIPLYIVYYALVWLSFISLFPFWARKLKSFGVKTYPRLAKVLVSVNFLYAIAMVVLGIYAGATYHRKMVVDLDKISSERHYWRDSILEFHRYWVVLVHASWVYVGITILLLCIFFRDVAKISKKGILPSILFFVFALSPVITELVVGLVDSSQFIENNYTAFLVLNFIFIDLCNIVAILVALIFSERWTIPFEDNKINSILPSSV